VVYRDSVAFFIVLFTLTLSLLPVYLLAPSHFNVMMFLVVRVAHSILCCRILLNIRRAASKGCDPTIEEGITNLVFATAPGQGTNQAETIRLEVHDGASVEEDFC